MHQLAQGRIVFVLRIDIYDLYFSKSNRLYSPLGILAVLWYSLIALTKVCGFSKYPCAYEDPLYKIHFASFQNI